MEYFRFISSIYLLGDENCSLNSSTSHQAMIKPKYSLNLHPGDSPTSGRSVMSNNKSVSKPLSLLGKDNQ